MKLTKSQLLKIIKEELAEANGGSYDPFETRPVIIPMSVANKLDVARTKGADWLEAYVGDAWDQISEDRSEKWRASQAFQSAASQMLYDLAQGYTKRLQDGEFSQPPPVQSSPPDDVDF